MTITMNDSPQQTIEELEAFLNSSGSVTFIGQGRDEIYRWVEQTIVKFDYHGLGKTDKGTVKAYLEKMTGYSRAQITRLIGKQRKTGVVTVATGTRHVFARKYTDTDIALLATTDELHDFPNGAAVKKILERMVSEYGEMAFAHIATISVGHLYNLRKSVHYRRLTKHYAKTKPTVVRIGERRKPEPHGMPGYVRVDTVHQGDDGKQKGVYHINMVDEVTQWEMAGSVEKISEAYLIPLLIHLLENCPFVIVEFHADNGGEYINRQLADMLNKLLIKLTKSRSRQTNDNALVESKNGSVIRKWMGYGYIDQRYAPLINAFYDDVFNEYLNYHRPCAFATETINKKGKIKKVYRQQDYQTPYEKLKSLPHAQSYLKVGITFEQLDNIAKQKNDNQMAKEVQEKRYQLFEHITSPYSSQQLI